MEQIKVSEITETVEITENSKKAKEALLEQIKDIEIDNVEKINTGNNIVLKAIKNSFLSVLNSKSNMKEYFLVDKYMFLSINKPSLKDLSEIDKKEAKKEFSVKITNFRKVEEKSKKNKESVLEKINRMDAEDLLSFGIQEFKELSEFESKSLKEIEAVNKKITDIIKSTDIKKTIDILKVL